ncbi:paraquat-inducible membrane protein A [Geovibrio thiophilus]|uniref:Paraquat-inducible membrane protein A n=1 Tax=Geovibrio thiophilus TaxID=139438 RepID=A0A410K1S9_9BACT|nr:paraquat-inducible protein A [Geovibrio thiophilus]QAR34400.1 paraquat-inducible membrane protein A [Geovibrio thiophilus]
MTDIEMNTALCLSCRQLIDASGAGTEGLRCPVCGSTVHPRRKNSLQKTWALTITALLLYIPANMLPVMSIETFADSSANTILGGVIELFENKMYFIAAVVFVASFIVPLFKLGSIFYLLTALRVKDRLTNSAKTRLFHLIEVIGKWSMLDIYVITIMAGLVNMGFLIQIKGGAGATFFAATVITTMLASKSFDTRLIWDKKGEQ